MQDAVKNVDFIISPSWIIPIIPSGEILSDFSVAVRGSKIISIHPSKSNKTLFQTNNVIELKDRMFLVINFTLVAMNLLRGFADDLPLMKWLENHIWPAESNLSRQTLPSTALYRLAMKCCAVVQHVLTTCIFRANR